MSGPIIVPKVNELVQIEVVNGQLRIQSNVTDPMRAIGLLDTAKASIQRQLLGGGEGSHIVGAHLARA